MTVRQDSDKGGGVRKRTLPDPRGKSSARLPASGRVAVPVGVPSPTTSELKLMGRWHEHGWDDCAREVANKLFDILEWLEKQAGKK